MPIYKTVLNILSLIFFDKQCYQDKDLSYDKALAVIPVFKSKQEHVDFIGYTKTHINEFKEDVVNQNIDEMFPDYAKMLIQLLSINLEKQWFSGLRIGDTGNINY